MGRIPPPPPPHGMSAGHPCRKSGCPYDAVGGGAYCHEHRLRPIDLGAEQAVAARSFVRQGSRIGYLMGIGAVGVLAHSGGSYVLVALACVAVACVVLWGETLQPPEPSVPREVDAALTRLQRSLTALSEGAYAASGTLATFKSIAPARPATTGNPGTR